MSVTGNAIKPELLFQGCSQRGKKYQAKCPVHDDNTASLSIAKGEKRWVAHCHAGCEELDVWKAVGLNFDDLRLAGFGQPPERDIEYKYYDPDGNHVYSAIRKSGKKKFLQKQANGTWSMKGVTRYPYNLPDVQRATTVYIVEGEKDAETLKGKGVAATCNVGGAGKWLNEYGQYLLGKEVFILSDNDEPGLEHAQDIKAKLGHGKIVHLPVSPKQDVTDFFEAGGELEELFELCKLPEQIVTTLSQNEPCKTATTASDCGLVLDRELTEESAAKKFIDEYLNTLRWVDAWGCWMVFDGKRWSKDERATKCIGMFRRFSESLRNTLLPKVAVSSATREDLSRTRTFIRRLQTNRMAKDVLSLARADARVMVEVDDFDRNPMVLNVQNGTLDFTTKELRPHSSGDLLTQLARVSFDPSAKCPRWLDALHLIFDGDHSLKIYVQQLFGYSFTGDIGEHILPIAYGSGCNGKSFLWNTLLELAGDYGILAHDSLLLGENKGHPAEKAQLLGKRFVAISEPDQNTPMRQSRVKELTGDSTINARAMRENFYNFRRTHKLWMATNHLPRVRGTDNGIWRRIKLVPFAVDISKQTQPIKNYHEVLAREEGPGILNWITEGVEEYLRAGFYEPAAVTEASDSYRREQDILGRFIADTCEVREGAVVRATDLFDVYKEWGGKLSQTNFGKQMAERFTKEKPTSGQHRRKVIYHGLELWSE